MLAVPGDALPRPHRNCYWVIPGRLLAGEHPGAVLAADVVARIDKLLDVGVRRFIDLTAGSEGPAPYLPVLVERAAIRRLGVAHTRHPIADFDVPSRASMRATLDAIYDAVHIGETLYLHCWGGVGRTGTVVGCLLREQGFSAIETRAVMNLKWQAMEKRDRHPSSPETREQLTFVERWTAD